MQNRGGVPDILDSEFWIPFLRIMTDDRQTIVN